MWQETLNKAEWLSQALGRFLEQLRREHAGLLFGKKFSSRLLFFTNSFACFLSPVSHLCFILKGREPRRKLLHDTLFFGAMEADGLTKLLLLHHCSWGSDQCDQVWSEGPMLAVVILLASVFERAFFLYVKGEEMMKHTQSGLQPQVWLYPSVTLFWEWVSVGCTPLLVLERRAGASSCSAATKDKHFGVLAWNRQFQV